MPYWLHFLAADLVLKPLLITISPSPIDVLTSEQISSGFSTRRQDVSPLRGRRFIPQQLDLVVSSSTLSFYFHMRPLRLSLCAIFQALFWGLSTRCRDMSSSRLDDMPPASAYRLYLQAAAFWRCYSGRDTSRRPSSAIVSHRCSHANVVFLGLLTRRRDLPLLRLRRYTTRHSVQLLVAHCNLFCIQAVSLLPSLFEMLPAINFRISLQYSELFSAQISTLSMRVLELRAMH